MSPAEIAKAFLSTEAAVAKHEGHKAALGSLLVREDLCREAIRLGELLAEHPQTARPRSRALLALMLLSAARLPAREDALGNLLRLEEQERARWDRTLIARGLRELALSSAGEQISAYHLQAGIAACHSAAPDYAATDWPQIVALYDQLLALEPSPIVALNRAIAFSRAEGAAAGIAAVAAIADDGALQSYHLYHATLAENAAERELLLRRLRKCESQAAAATMRERLTDRREASG